MNRWLRVAGALGLLLVVAAPTYASINVNVTYTADNIVAAFYKDGSSPQVVPLGPNANDWQKADTTTISLDPDEYDLIFRVKNLTTPAPSSSNPVGFLAQIVGTSGAVYTSGSWQYAVAVGTAVPDFTTLSWQNATTWGYNGGANIWTSVHGGPIAGISTAAQWIWSKNDFNPLEDNDLWLKCTFVLGPTGQVSPIPEPTSLLIWSAVGLGGAAMVTLRRRRAKAE
jgi:hypothetical protein